jgi:cold shock CspA family protein
MESHDDWHDGLVVSRSLQRGFCIAILSNGQEVFCHRNQIRLLPGGHFCKVEPGSKLKMRLGPTPQNRSPEALEAVFHEDNEVKDFPERETSTITFWDQVRNFGFAARECGDSIFVGVRSFRSDDFSALAKIKPGLRINHGIEIDKKGVVATDITIFYKEEL